MNSAPALQINSQTRESALQLKQKYLTSSATLPEMLRDLAAVLGSDSGQLYDTIANWISTCEEAQKFGDEEPPFPPKIVIIRDSAVRQTKLGAKPTERGSGKAPPPKPRAPAKNQAKSKGKCKEISQVVSTQSAGKRKETVEVTKTLAGAGERKGKGKGKTKTKAKSPAEETEEQTVTEEEQEIEMEKGVETDPDAEGESEVEVTSNNVPVGVPKQTTTGMSIPNTRGKKRKDKGTGPPTTKRSRLVPKGTVYNPSMKKAAHGSILGASMQDALDEEDVEFAGDVEELEKGFLHVRAATNFVFVDIEGNHVSVGEGEQPRGVFLIACCGSLNVQTESGQRLLAGWWNPDPDPEEEAYKASIEVLWVKIPVRSIEVDEELWLRDEQRKLITVNGDVGIYVLQTPDPTYAPRWTHCFTNFTAAEKWLDVSPSGPCPAWFDDKWWRVVKDEYSRWLQLGESLDLPQIQVSKKENHLLKLQGFLAYHEAKYRALDGKIKWTEGLIQSGQSHKRPGRRGERRTVAERNRQKELKEHLTELPTWRTELAETKTQVEAYKRKVQVALRSASVRNLAQESSHETSDPVWRRPASISTSSSGSSPTTSPLASAPVSPQPQSGLEQFSVPGPSGVEKLSGAETSPAGTSTPPPAFGTQAAKLGDRSDIVPVDPDSDMSESESESEARPAPSSSRTAPSTLPTSASEIVPVPSAEPEHSGAGSSLFLGGMVDGLGSPC